jgi:L-ascorbate metabolism protein UlaG (beta-lactamase superfamily)
LEARGFTGGIPMETWDSVTFNNGQARLKITSMPGKHGPPIVDVALPDVMGSMLDFEDAHGQRMMRLYITGDTLIHDDINEIPKRFPGVDLALLHLGGTRVLGVLVTMDDEQGVEMMRIIQPEKAIPIHYNDYDVFKSPLEDFKRRAEEAGFSDRLIYLTHGETYEFRAKAGTASRSAEM